MPSVLIYARPQKTMANCECGVNDPWLVSIASAIVEQICTLGTRLGLCVEVPCCDPSCREVLFLSLCVGCFRPHTVLCVLGKHSGSHTCILCVVMVAPPPPLHSASFCFLSPPPPFPLLLSSPFPFYLTPLFPSTLTPLLPVTLPLTLTPLLPISLPTHSSPSTPPPLPPPPLSLLSYPVGPSLGAGNSVWNRPVCGAGCLLCASHSLRTVSWPPLISGDYITVCISVVNAVALPMDNTQIS